VPNERTYEDRKKCNVEILLLALAGAAVVGTLVFKGRAVGFTTTGEPLRLMDDRSLFSCWGKESRQVGATTQVALTALAWQLAGENTLIFTHCLSEVDRLRQVLVPALPPRTRFELIHGRTKGRIIVVPQWASVKGFTGNVILDNLDLFSERNSTRVRDLAIGCTRINGAKIRTITHLSENSPFRIGVPFHRYLT